MTSFNRNSTGIEVVSIFSSRLEGKTILITGPSIDSLGAETALSLAHSSPTQLVLLGRSEAKVQPVVEKVKLLNSAIDVRFINLDLANQDSIRSAAKQINEDSTIKKIDILINNAGVMAVPDYQTTKEGIELQFGSNHVGHFLLTNLLMPKILVAGKGDGARIVNVSSTGYKLGGVLFDEYNFQDGKIYKPWPAYAQSKTANVLFSAALANRLKSKGVQSYSLQPGLVMESNLSNHVTPEMWGAGLALSQESGGDQIMEAPKTLQEGCATTLVAALDPTITGQSGIFLQDGVVSEVVQDHAKGKENESKLWALSEKLVGQKFEL